jgi:hypothetical protein
MRKACLSVLLAAAAVLGASAAWSQTEIMNVAWELSRLNGKARLPYAAVAELRASPEVNFQDYLRALVTLRNPSARPVEGLVLRYSLSLKLLKKGDAPEKAFWAVPFSVEEVRVTKINPQAEKQAKLIRFELQNQLRKLRNTGFAPLALKMQVMVCPRQGDEPAAIMREAVIDIKP